MPWVVPRVGGEGWGALRRESDAAERALRAEAAGMLRALRAARRRLGVGDVGVESLLAPLKAVDWQVCPRYASFIPSLCHHHASFMPP